MSQSLIVTELKSEIQKNNRFVIWAMIILMTPLYLTIIAIAYNLFVKK